MGNTNTKDARTSDEPQSDYFEGGYFVPQGVYTSPQDFNSKIVRHLIAERKIAPFYKGLPDYDENMSDQDILDQLGLDKFSDDHASDPPTGGVHHTSSEHVTKSSRALSFHDSNIQQSFTGASRPRSQSGIAGSKVSLQSPFRRPLEALLYRNAEECPICFLYYPPFLNHTRCCHQSICSECFVQIKRPDPHLVSPHPTTTNSANNSGASSAQTASSNSTGNDDIVSEPATCPFCVESDFGVVYDPPNFKSLASGSLSSTSEIPSSSESMIRRSKKDIIPLSDSRVVTIDTIRPDWQQKLALARADRTRRQLQQAHLTQTIVTPSGRRIVIRQGTGGNGDRRRAYANRSIRELEVYYIFGVDNILLTSYRS